MKEEKARQTGADTVVLVLFRAPKHTNTQIHVLSSCFYDAAHRLSCVACADAGRAREKIAYNVRADIEFPKYEHASEHRTAVQLTRTKPI